MRVDSAPRVAGHAEANVVFDRMDTVEAGDVHARPNDMVRTQVWIEQHAATGAWITVEGSVRNGILDTAKRF